MVGIPSLTTYHGSSVDDAGEAWVFDGGSLLGEPNSCVYGPFYRVVGTQALGLLGKSVALVDDVSLDGMSDVAVGAPDWDASGSDPDRGVARFVLSSH